MKTLFFIIGVLLCCSSFAQKDSTKFLSDTTTLESVTVTAFGSNAKWKDAPAAVALINQQQLQRFDNKTLVPVLNTVAGVRMEERSPGSYRLSIRGSLIRSPFGVRNIRVYWNDIPLTDAGGNTYLNLVDLNALSSIEIIKGPASSMYGANTGGALLLKSNPSVFNQKNIFNAGIETGSYGLLNEQLGWNHHTEKLSFSIQQSHLQNDGYRQQSALRRDNILGDLTWNINTHEQLSALLFYTNLHYETPGGITKQQFDSLPTLARLPTSTLPGAIQQHAGVYNKTGFAGFSLKSVFSNLWSNTTTLTVNHTDFKNPFITNYEKRDELNYGARTVFEMDALKFKWLTGAEWQQNVSHINNFDNNNGVAGDLMYDDDVHVQQYFLFTQANFQFRRLTVQAGASLNKQQLKYNRVSDPVYNFWQHQNTKFLLAPRLSALYSITNTASVYGIIAKGFSPPTLAEVRPSTDQFYNLQPEYGWNFEAGIKGSALNNFLSFDASVYTFKLRHAIVQQQDSTGADYFVNAGSIKENGAEVWIDASIIRNKNSFINNLSVSNSFTYQPYKFNNYISGTKNYAGNHETGVPKTMDVITLDLNTSPGIYLNANANFTSSIPLTDANDVYAGSYKLVQLKLGYKHQFKKTILDFFAGIDNLLNKKYSLGNDLNAVGGRYFNAAPARNYFAGLRANF
ncbi:MAG TPA: TonB-dependent receptor [Parafilimonas sp.]|nr:TonB-dependent receptor [Parafilimonas sp.]